MSHFKLLLKQSKNFCIYKHCTKFLSLFTVLIILAVSSGTTSARTLNTNSYASFWGVNQYVWSLFGYSAVENESKQQVGEIELPPPPSLGDEAETSDSSKTASIIDTSLAPQCNPTGVTLNVGPAQPYTSIQDAINAANPSGGDKIKVDAGTYAEQLIVNKCVIIQGNNRNDTFIQPPAILSNSTVPGAANTQSVVEIRSNSYVTMSKLTVQGPVPFTAANGFGIFVVENSTLDLSDADIKDIRENPIQGNQRGRSIGIGRQAPTNQIGSLIINNVTISGYQKSGIEVARQGSTATINNTTITGAGPTSVIAQNGIVVRDGAAATITGNTISGNDYTPASNTATGIILFNAGATVISNNTISNNGAGIYNYFDVLPPTVPTTTVTGNNLTGNLRYGMYFERANTTVSDNFVSGGQYGIGAFPINTSVVQIKSNSVVGASSGGIVFDDYASGTVASAQLSANFNRISGNAVGMQNDSNSPVNATNNFWGCNAGPTSVGMGCDTTAGTGIGLITANPYLRLTGNTAVPTSVPQGGTSTVSGTNLRVNSAGVNTFTDPATAGQSVPDGIVVTYTANFGTVLPTSTTLVDGLSVGSTTFTAGTGYSGDQNGGVTATVDNANDTVPILVTDETNPTVTINQKTGQPDPANSVPVEFTAVFSEVVSGFDNTDVTITGVTYSSIVVTTSDNQTFNIAVTPTSNGIVTANIGAGKALDPANNPNTAATFTDNQVAFFTGALEFVVDDLGSNCLANGAPVYTTIQAAVAAANPGYIIRVCSGTYTVGSNISLNKIGLTIIAAEPTKPLVNVSGSGNSFTVSSSGVTINGLNIVKTDAVGIHNIITVQGTNFSGKNNDFTATTPWQSSGVTRGYEISGSATGMLIDGNTFTDVRQPAYINGDGNTVIGTVSNNTITRTKGWAVDGALVNFTGNIFGQTCSACDTDIALFNNVSSVYQNFYLPNVLAISTANDNAHIDVQFTAAADSGRAISYVNKTAPAGGDGRIGTPYQRIQQAVFDPAAGIVDGTLPGGTVNVAAGSYNEDVAVDRTLKIIGAGAPTTTVSGPIGGGGSTFQLAASNIDLSGFTITRDGNNTTDWNNPGLNTAGISIQGQSFTGNVVHDNIITGMRTAVDVNNSNGHTFRNNVIDTNRTGFIFRNQTDNTTVVENTITNNFTVGILFLDGSGGTNSPVQTALNSAFINNNLSGNWYGQIVDRQTGGSLPAPGASPKKLPGQLVWNTDTCRDDCK